ncbi:hypothetical protein JRG42_20085 [Pseudomonas granadensis]|uniref:Uncharacterized protein n=1 Tax=Pseudomonas granadensis TaxID=1421430 RepID=A0ABX7GJM9_9PSED|nr:hypothetical protein [Pseudomonas granadensis]MBN6775444.1 hypothetical protein [Pseudomonas granadensis]MBN6806737.1 hypothetical protein [Pseudomonas granadensis]MBN6833606.1 hypothetical protein [Pseudomonas granadensis]MBN6840983.1 hypothetical protein [Pseudomonas granadensis]MBN6866614.1 hypothetical protein [Pseudomonas granadensis]
MQWTSAILLLTLAASGASQAAEINLSSATDFSRMEVLLKDDEGANPDHVQLSVTLTPEATEGVAQISQKSIGKPLTLSINGQPVSTATVHSALGRQFRIAIPRPIAKNLLPTLID